ncbi:unnamed protein product [Bemisia tabaci]|uniref:MADF domain-containing protein n=1 Tax=Bemisia tabaci TaxID=7038 RepID=A0A9P0F5M6_BEMTA|nr:unnamed protein product [Bemisia tabaci]
MQWSREKKDEFIVELQKKPYLYDENDKDYKNRFLRSQARMELKFKFKSTYRGIGNRISRLKKSYFKPRALQKSSSPTLDQGKIDISSPRSKPLAKDQMWPGEIDGNNASMSAKDEINKIRRFLEDDSFLKVLPAWTVPCSNTLCCICTTEDNQSMNLPGDNDSRVGETLLNLQEGIVSSTGERTSMPDDINIHSEQVQSESENYRYLENNAIQTSGNISSFTSSLTNSFIKAHIGSYVSAKLKIYDENDSLKIIQEIKEIFFRYDFLREAKR